MSGTTPLDKQSNDSTFDNVWDELVWRGLVHVSTDAEALRTLLGGEPITYYCGFDPTAPSLHLGHLVQLLLMRRLQLAGHRPLGLVGGSTGLIGDPRPTSERQLHDKATVAGWVRELQEQVAAYFTFDGDNAARLVDNLDWTESLSAIDFLRDLGKHFRVGAMLKKDAVSARLNSDAGISYTEFSYQILQALDYLELNRRYDCVLQTGGSDQWGNLTGGADLIHRVERRTAHAIGSPLITNSDGTKFGKSEGNAIWLDPALTSPYAFYQFWLNVDDADVIDRLKVFTFRSREEVAVLEVEVDQRPYRRQAQLVLAEDVTALVHGPRATAAVQQASRALFGDGDLHDLDGDMLAAALTELPHCALEPGMTIGQAAVATGLVASLGQARRAAAQHGLKINNQAVTDADRPVGDHLIRGRAAVIRRGKKTLAGVLAAADGAS